MGTCARRSKARQEIAERLVGTRRGRVCWSLLVRVNVTAFDAHTCTATSAWIFSDVFVQDVGVKRVLLLLCSLLSI